MSSWSYTLPRSALGMFIGKHGRNIRALQDIPLMSVNLHDVELTVHSEDIYRIQLVKDNVKAIIEESRRIENGEESSRMHQLQFNVHSDDMRRPQMYNQFHRPNNFFHRNSANGGGARFIYNRPQSRRFRYDYDSDVLNDGGIAHFKMTRNKVPTQKKTTQVALKSRKRKSSRLAKSDNEENDSNEEQSKTKIQKRISKKRTDLNSNDDDDNDEDENDSNYTSQYKSDDDF